MAAWRYEISLFVLRNTRRGICGHVISSILLLILLLLIIQATRGARNSNLQVVITHASHVCSQHSLGLPLRMFGMHRTHFDLLTRGAKAFWPSIVVARIPQALVINYQLLLLSLLLAKLPHPRWSSIAIENGNLTISEKLAMTSRTPFVRR